MRLSRSRIAVEYGIAPFSDEAKRREFREQRLHAFWQFIQVGFLQVLVLWEACRLRRPAVEWMKTLETARMMLYKVFADMIDAKVITKAQIKVLAAQCFTKQGEPLHLAKPKKEISVDADAMENFLPTFSDL
jgi:hypothetical protein